MTGLGTHPTSYSVRTGFFFFPGYKAAGAAVKHSLTSAAVADLELWHTSGTGIDRFGVLLAFQFQVLVCTGDSRSNLERAPCR